MTIASAVSGAKAASVRRSLPILTNSALSTARSCLRLYRNRYVLGLRPVQHREDAPELGDLVHVGLEAWWLGHGEQRIFNAIKAARAHAAAEKIDQYQLARAEVMLIGYHARWADEAEHYEVISVEVEFRSPLINPATSAASKSFHLGGKLDGVVRDRRDARVLILEHKTSSEDIGPGGFYWLRRHMDGQVSTYFDGARALGHDPQGCLYDVLAKLDQRPSAVPVLDSEGEKVVLDAAGQRVRTKDGKRWRQTGDAALGYVLQTRQERPDEFRARLIEKLVEDPESYFARAEVARDSEDLREARRDRWQLGTILRDSHRTGTWPRNPDACLRYGRPCEFLEACAGRADLGDPFLFRKQQNVHPELHPELNHEPGPSREDTAA